MKDYYGLLGVESSASRAEIKKNFRRLATTFHPDKNDAPDAAEKFMAVTEAYEVLREKKSRAEYDLMRWHVAKQAREKKEEWTVVEPPRESLTTRRRKAQKKRSIQFHQAKDSEKRWLLIKESFIILGRYIFHVIGFGLMIIILYSAISQVVFSFQQSPGIGIGTSLFAVALVYGLYKLGGLTLEELQRDSKTFSAILLLGSLLWWFL